MEFQQGFDVMCFEMSQRGNSHMLAKGVIEGIKESCIFILGASYKLIYFQSAKNKFEDVCTIGERGFGEIENSCQSPRGLHDIGGIVGIGGDERQAIECKKVTGKVLPSANYGEFSPGITSRVIILNGLEKNLMEIHIRDLFISIEVGIDGFGIKQMMSEI